MTTAEIDRRIANFFRALFSPEFGRQLAWVVAFICFLRCGAEGDLKTGGIYCGLMSLLSYLDHVSRRIDAITPRDPLKPENKP
jgi:hypothetical protein